MEFERPSSGDSKEPLIHSGTTKIPLEPKSPVREQLIRVLNTSDPTLKVWAIFLPFFLPLSFF